MSEGMVAAAAIMCLSGATASLNEEPQEKKSLEIDVSNGGCRSRSPCC